MTEQALHALKKEPVFSGRQSKPGEGTQHQRGNACWLSIVPYFSLCVGPSTLLTDSGGRKTYRSNRILPQRGTCVVLFSCSMSLPSSHHDEERRAWAKAELINYVTGNESWLSNGLLKVGRASRVQLVMPVKTLCSFFIVTQTVGGTLISYQNGGGNDPRTTNLSLLVFTLLHTHVF